MAQSDVFMTSRNRNLLTYRNNNAFGYVDGLSFALQYQGKNTEDNKSNSGVAYKNNGDGFGLSTAYDLGWGVSLGGGYSSSARTEPQKLPQLVVIKLKHGTLVLNSTLTMYT